MKKLNGIPKGAEMNSIDLIYNDNENDKYFMRKDENIDQLVGEAANYLKTEKSLEQLSNQEQFKHWIELDYTKKVLKHLSNERLKIILDAERNMLPEPAHHLVIESRTIRYVVEILSNPIVCK